MEGFCSIDYKGIYRERNHTIRSRLRIIQKKRRKIFFKKVSEFDKSKKYKTSLTLVLMAVPIELYDTISK